MERDYCHRKAEECELMAAEATDVAERREWLRMAAEWRLSVRPEADVPADENRR